MSSKFKAGDNVYSILGGIGTVPVTIEWEEEI